MAPNNFRLYHYDPSEGAAIAFIHLFMIAGLVQIFRMCRSKIWFFIPFAIGSVLEVVGYIARTVNASQTPDWKLGAYIIQSLALLLPPAFFAASIYMSLGRLIRAVQREDLSIIRPTWMTKIFVGGDVMSFLVQSSGAGIQSSKKEDSFKVGGYIIMGGLAIQLIYFGFFIVAAGIFHRRVHKAGVPHQILKEVSWRTTTGVIYAVSILILIRSIYRLVEYAQGQSGELMAHESYFYVFDAALMLIVVVLYAAFPPKELSRQVRGSTQNMEEGHEFEVTPKRHLSGQSTSDSNLVK